MGRSAVEHLPMERINEAMCAAASCSTGRPEHQAAAAPPLQPVVRV